ncbi:MAG: glycosyltransferase family 4 protein [Lachnospiraceae bacterium]|nr:glycosyltransferase family 4 protein [Lachnospiraceae bacterium]
MKKICIVSMGYMWFPVESGPSRFFQIAQTFVNCGYEVEVITTDFQHFKKDKRETKLIQAQNYPFQITFIETKPYKKNVDFRRVLSNRGVAKNLKAYLNLHIKEYDAVYCSIPANDVAAAASKICKANNVPFIVDIEDLWPEAMSMVVKNATLRKILFHSFQKDAETTYQNCDAAIGTSEDYTARAVKYNHRDLPMETVYVGCNLEDFDGGVEIHKREVEKPEDEFWLSYAGSISTSYDIKNVIDAVILCNQELDQMANTTQEHESIDSNIKKIHLQILGTGSEKDMLEAYVKEQGLDYVHFWGFTAYPRMAAALDASDVVINSFVKGAPQSIVNKVGDYLASGKPMLNTLENPIFCNLVEKHQIGTNIEPGNAKALKEAILAYYNDPQKAETIGRNARNLAETAFDRKTSYRKIVEVTERAIDKGFAHRNDTISK